MSKERSSGVVRLVQKQGMRELAREVDANRDLREQEKQLQTKILAVENAIFQNRTCMAAIQNTLLGSLASGSRLVWAKAHVEQLRGQTRILESELVALRMRMEEVTQNIRQSDQRLQTLHARHDVLQDICTEQLRQQHMAREESLQEEMVEDCSVCHQRDF